MLRVCQDGTVDCPDDITGNFSSEADDTLDFISRKFAPAPPKLKNLWTQTACGITFISGISQADADQQAAAAAALCTQCQPNCGTFCNTPQVACFSCPDGTQSCFNVPAGSFCGYGNQAAADSAAFQFAKTQAKRVPICPSALVRCTCVGSGYQSTITTAIPVTWTLIGGSLPPGLAFSGGFGQIASVFGIPNTAGTYNFQIEAQGSEGNLAIKTYTIVVLQVATTSLPPFTIGVPYSVQLQAIGGSGNYNWRITSGSLPNGLTMSITGLISGTPQ